MIPRFLDRVTESEVGPLAGKRHQREAEQQRSSVLSLWKLWGIRLEVTSVGDSSNH